MKTKFLKIISALFIIAWPLLLQSQTITTTAGSPSACPGDIVVPLTVTNCNGVGAISLVLEYNIGVLSYQGYENLHPALTSGFLIVHPSANRVIISWASTTAANISNSTLMNLHFTGATGSSSLTWDTQTPGNCEFSDAGGNILPSAYANGTATVYQPPQINVQPVDVTALEHANVSFSVNAIATGIEHLWYVSNDGGINWFPTSVTSATLNINDVSLSMNGNLYRCEINGTCDPVAVSDAAELTVIQPLITSFDVQNVCPGTITIPVLTSHFTDVAAFSLAFSYNTGVLTYAGFQNANPSLTGNFVCNENNGMVYMTWSGTTPVTFQTDTTLVEFVFDGTAGGSDLNWDLTTPGNCEYIYLNAEPIVSVFENENFTIYSLPQITVQPLDKLVAENTATSFSVSATGTNLDYQWQLSTDDGVEWDDISGADHSTYNISNVTLGMSGNLYRCVVSGTCTPDAVSDPAELTVLLKITAIAETVSGCPGELIVSIDVTHFIDVASFSLALTWDPAVLTFDMYQNLSTALSSGNFALNSTSGVVYLTWASLSPVTIGDDQLLELVFDGTTGNTAMNWLDEQDGQCEFANLAGNIIFDDYVNGTVTVYQPPVISSNPGNQTAPAQTGISFSCSATGTGIGFHWEESTDGGANWDQLVNGGSYSGVTSNMLQINPVLWSMDQSLYRCNVTGACPPDVSTTAAMLDVIPEVIGTSAGDVENSCSGNISIPVYVSNCTNVGAISLALNYDPAKLTYTGFDSPHTELSSGMLIVNNTGSQVILSWASIDPANIGGGTLIHFNFSALAGISTTVSWDTQNPGNCEYSDPNGFIYVATFNSENISISSNALVVDAGDDETIAPGGSVQLNGNASGGSTPYTINWSPVNWLDDPNILNPMADPPSTTTYTLTVIDNSGCEASDQMTVNVSTAGIDLDLKVFLEGAFESSEMRTDLNSRGLIPWGQPYAALPWNYGGSEYVNLIPGANVTEWILVELRETSGGPATATASAMIARQAGFVLKSGTIVATDGSNSMHFDVNITSDLYVVIWHRNHLPVMSSGALPNTGSTYSWDFTTSANQAYGTSAQVDLGEGIFGMFAGDADANGTVETEDMTVSWHGEAGQAGYHVSDLNLNGEVNNQDKNDVWYKNKGESSQVPQ